MSKFDPNNPLGGVEEEHESFGVIGVSRVSGQTRLFNSPLEHHNYIEISVKRATKRRSLKHDWIHGKEDIVRLAMSEMQFATMITTLNHGEGVPCTLTRVNGKGMDKCPFDGTRETFNSELKEDLSDLRDKTTAFENAVNTLVEGTKLTKTEKQLLRGLAESIKQEVNSNLPFLHETFVESMDKVVTAAKIDFDAHVEIKTRSMGLEALAQTLKPPVILEAEQLPALPEGSDPQHGLR